ncbi:sigma factor-like helix-turn-helix DNA-binding protein [Cetobacterium sp.]|uniref:sigma factor-like helix-turn-helix DNA-binding protein n=1 Tax=Cetobacterium sp. TaxID=2071632 RepID=UPI0025C6DEBD|nr:sigma factor-like helix-turn-helix DNA-binding protein [Cetobacterium sp.]
MSKVFLRELKEFLALLTPQQEKVFQLYYVENKGYSATGRDLDISRQRVEILCKAIKLKLEKVDLSDLISRLGIVDSKFEDKGIMINISDFKAELSRKDIALDINEVVVLYKLFKGLELEFFEDRYILAKSKLKIDKDITDCFKQKRILALTDLSCHLRGYKLYSLIGLEELLNKNPNIVEFKGFYMYAKRIGMKEKLILILNYYNELPLGEIRRIYNDYYRESQQSSHISFRLNKHIEEFKRDGNRYSLIGGNL